jgi:hypothetical protein
MDSAAQSFLGLSINYGDRLNFTNSPSLLLKRRSFSPTLVYSEEKKLSSNLSVIFGGQLGVAAYQLVPIFDDSFGSAHNGERYPFVDYGILVGRLESTIGHVFRFRKKDIFVGLGGGASYYRGFEFTTMSVSVDGIQAFSSFVEFPYSGSINGFAKIYIKTRVSSRLDLAFQYSTHWRSILNGEFEFDNTKVPSAGSIRLVPRGVSLMILYRLGRREVYHP